MKATLKVFLFLVVLIAAGFLYMHGRHHWGWGHGMNGQMGGMMGGSGGMMGGINSMMDGMHDMMHDTQIPGSAPPAEQQPALKSGYKLAQQFCTQCHTLPNPNLHSRSEWSPILTRMRGHIQEFNKNAPTEPQWQQILNYYQERSR